MASARTVKPKLRGVPDVIALALAVPAGILLILWAASGIATTAAAIYAGSLVLLFAASTLYHLPTWREPARLVLRRLDHSAIFLLIAGTYTPVCLLVLEPSMSQPVLTGVWITAGAGALKSVLWPRPPRWLNAMFYLTMGWVIFPFVVIVFTQAGATVGVLILTGGLLYTVGAVGYVRRWPDPMPRVFGYHEVFHVFVIAAATCHYLAIWRVVSAFA